MYKEHKTEPFWWGMFSFGGVIAAMLVPVHIFLNGLAVPLGLIDPELVAHERITALLANPWIKLYLFVLIALPFYHAAHRIRFSLYELGVREFTLSMHILCYGAALIGTALAAYVLWVLL